MMINVKTSYHLIVGSYPFLAIINDVLDISRIEAGGLKLEDAAFDFDDHFDHRDAF